MSKSIMIVMPLPSKELHQNHRLDFVRSVKQRNYLKKIMREKIVQYRDSAFIKGKKLLDESMPWHKADSKLHFFFRDGRTKDIRNFEAALKPAWDGLVSAGVFMSDDHKYLTHDRSAVDYDKQNPRVEITITRLEINNAKR